jgi:adenine-specific DNA-methyltransferase
MQNLLNDLVALLEQDERLVIEGQLLKNKVIELALALDRSLIRLLLSSDGIRRHFFQDVDSILVFDKIKFQQFVSNKAFLPDSYTAFKNKIGLTAEGSYLTDSKEVVLAWPYKDCVLEGGQTKEDAKRNEVFWNETLAPDQIDRLLAPKALTNFKKFDKDGEHKVTNINHDDNLLIKGNNLLALHTLKKAYSERVKLIFIDPPFNTENDTFQYNDSFTQSTWFTFLKNRLEIAKKLMAKDASIFVHIDQDNKHPIKMMLDEIFGRDNFRNEIILPGRAVKNLQQQFTSIKKLQVRHDTLFWYTKSPEVSFTPFWIEKHDVGNVEGHWHHAWSTEERKTMQYELLGTKIDKGQWVWGEERANRAVKNYDRYLEESGGRTLAEYWMDTGKKLSFIRKSPDDGKPQYWRPPAELRLADTVWAGVPISSSEHGFKTAKNEKYLAEVIKLASSEGDIVLDFFSGSGTTLAAAHKLNRQWVGIEQLDYIDTITVNRLKEVAQGDSGGISASVNWQGGGSFIYCELTKANQTFVDQIQTAENSERLTAIWQTMQNKAFLSYRIDPKTIDLASADFTALSLDDQKRFLIEVMDKNMLYVPVSEIDDITYGIRDEDKKLNRQFFGEN